MIRFQAALVGAAALSLGAAVSALGAEFTKVIPAVRADSAPVIDGVLDDPVWALAVVVDDLHEVSPDEYSPISEPSWFYVLYTRDAIYVGAKLWDSHPDNVVAKVLRKGDSTFGEETVTVLLDPHNNGRSGYMFDLNANGVRNEAVFTDVTQENWQWEGIWHGAARKDGEGWVAELEIPFKTLSLDPANDTWGINFMRWRARAGEFYGWVSGNGAVNPANSGKLKNLVGADQGLGLDVAPGVRIAERRDFATGQTMTELDPSLDLFYKLTPAMTAALTANTDFSGTGADQRQINLSRFSLFFPERRAFFLQDTDIFEFGRIGGGEPYFSTTLDQVERESARPFFSRRIGLSDSGSPIDLDVGGKLTGRMGRWEIGLLDIQQAAHDSVPSTNLFVGRIAANLFGESMIGAIVTHGDPLSNIDNRLFGADFRYLNTQLPGGGTIEGAVWYQQTDTDGLVGDDAAFGLTLKVPSAEGLRGGLGFKEIQANYHPALGFVNRDNVRDYSLEFGYTWIPGGERLRKIYGGVDAERIDTIAGDLQSQLITLRPLEIESPASDQLNVHYSLYEEQLVQPFEISEGIFIQPGRYSFEQACVWPGSGQHRALAVELQVCDGGFYDGDALYLNGELSWRPTRHFRLLFGYEINDIDLPQGSFITRLVSVRADVAFTNTWSWQNFIQYDNVSDSLGLNSILRWLPRAGREMLIEVNREFLDSSGRRSFRSASSDIALRIRHTFRF